MNLEFIETVLNSFQGFEYVGHATDLDFIGNSKDTIKLPSVFYHPWSEDAMGFDSIDDNDAIIEINFGIKVVAKNTELATVRRNIKQLLLGHKESGMLTPIMYRKGEVINVEKSIIWWRDIYSFKTQINP